MRENTDREEGTGVECDHKKLRCTNGEFFCLTCGKKLDLFDLAKPEKVPKKKPAAKKGATKE